MGAYDWGGRVNLGRRMSRGDNRSRRMVDTQSQPSYFICSFCPPTNEWWNQAAGVGHEALVVHGSSSSFPLQGSPRFLFPKRSMSTSPCSDPCQSKKEKVIVVSGPTGAGKSRLALELAKRLGGEIISADSVHVYHGLDIGSAKPSSSDRKDVAHHLLDVLHQSEEYSVGQFFEDASKATRDVLRKGRVPIVAGGTGLYLWWYIYGKPDVSKASVEITSEVCLELMELQKNGQWDAAGEMVVNAGDSKARLVPYNDWYHLR